jgi:hypothetical protein
MPLHHNRCYDFSAAPGTRPSPSRRGESRNYHPFWVQLPGREKPSICGLKARRLSEGVQLGQRVNCTFCFRNKADLLAVADGEKYHRSCAPAAKCVRRPSVLRWNSPDPRVALGTQAPADTSVLPAPVWARRPATGCANSLKSTIAAALATPLTRDDSPRREPWICWPGPQEGGGQLSTPADVRCRIPVQRGTQWPLLGRAA